MFFSFRMPLFFIVSGIFLSASFAKRGMREYVATKAKTILYPYFVWGALQITLQLFFSQYVNHPPTAFNYLYLLYLPREIEQFWYLYALFNVSVLYVILKYRFGLKPWHHIVLGLVLFYVSALSYQHDAPIGFLKDIMHYYIFIVIGDFLRNIMKKPENIKLFQSWKVFFILLIPFVASQSYFLWANLKFPGSHYNHVEYYQPYFFLIIALVGCAFILSICFLFQRYHKPAWLRVLGKHSLYIYVAHVIAFASLRVLMVNVFHIDNVIILLITGIVSGLLIPIWLYKISIRFNMQWLFSLDDNHLPKDGKWIKLTLLKK